MMKSSIPTETIPEPLKTLLAKHDNDYTATALAVGYTKTGSPALRRIAKGEEKLGPVMKARIEAALKGKDPRAAAVAAGSVVRTPKVAGEVLREVKQTEPPKKLRKMSVHKLADYPPLIQELIEKYGSTIKAAHALGMKSQYWITKFYGDGAKDFDAEAMAKVRAALKGEIAPTVKLGKAKSLKKLKKAKANGAAHDPDDQIDAGVLGIAIVLSTPQTLEALYDAGEAMGGEWVFKKRVGKQWLSVCRLDQQELHAFRAIARVIAIEVATP